MHNQQCLIIIHISYEHREVKNEDEQADRVDVGMGGLSCSVSIFSIYILKFIYVYIYIYFIYIYTLGSNTFSLASSWPFVFTQLGSPRFI